MGSPVRVAFNGIGRITRQALPLFAGNGYEIVAINGVSDVTKKQLRSLLEFDSVYGWTGNTATVEGDRLFFTAAGCEQQEILLLNERGKLYELPWDDLGIDLVIEATGKHTADVRGNLDAGAKKVILTAPAKKPEDVDTTIVVGANEQDYDPARHHVVSNASCTTNAAAPIYKVLGNKWGIEGGNITTIHAFTTSQNLLDNRGKDTARARQVAGNIIPTTTGVGKALGLVYPVPVTATAFRVDSPAGSVLHFDPVVLGGQPTVEEVKQALFDASRGEYAGIIQCWEKPYGLTANMVVGNSCSVVVDLASIVYNEQTGGFYITSFYDNECGYSYRLKDLAGLMMGIDQEKESSYHSNNPATQGLGYEG